MRKIVTWILFLPLVLAAAKPNPNDLTRFTVINQSPYPLEISLSGQLTETMYFLKVPKGNTDVTVEKDFTIQRDVYQMSIHYVELWDPVYGPRCGAGQGGTLNAMHNNRIIVKDCTATRTNNRSSGPQMTPVPGSSNASTQIVPADTSILTACQGLAERSFTRSITCS
jgi:hypothetical protein